MTDWIPPCAPWGRRSPRFLEEKAGHPLRRARRNGETHVIQKQTREKEKPGPLQPAVQAAGRSGTGGCPDLRGHRLLPGGAHPDRWEQPLHRPGGGRGVRHPAGRQPVPAEQGADLRGYPAKAALCGGADHRPAPAQHHCHRDPGVGRGGQHPALQRDFNGGGTSGGGGRGH